MNYPSSPSSTDSESSSNVNNCNLNYGLNNNNSNMMDGNKYKWYSERPKEIDYDPPEFIPPSDDEDSEEEEEQQNENKDTDENTNMYETRNENYNNNYENYNNYNNNKSTYSHEKYYNNNNNKQRRQPRPRPPPPPPPPINNNNYTEQLKSKPKIHGWGGDLYQSSKIMLKTVDRIEKRQLQIDKMKTKVNNAKAKLELQNAEYKKQIQYDKQIILNEFNQIEKQMDTQYNSLKNNLNSTTKFLNKSANKFGKVHDQVAKCLWIKNSNSNTNQKLLKKEAEINMKSFDNNLKKLNICDSIDPKLKYISTIKEKYKQFETNITNHMFNLNNNEEKHENKIVFFDGIIIDGIIPELPNRIDISLTKSYKKKEEESNEEINQIISSPSPPLSEISLATSAKFNVYKNIRVMILYNQRQKWNMKTINTLEHEIIIELKNTKPHTVVIDSSVNFYEWNVYQDLKIYEGNVKLRSRNKNGWSEYKTVKFKFDENGNCINDL